MVEIGQDPNVDLLSYSEVISVNGKPGNYKVKILKKARRVSLTKCIGCGACVEACPYEPGKIIIERGRDKESGSKAMKCDLCISAPYHWESCGGGPGGKQACVEVCPVKAISFTPVMPSQDDDSGYDINMRRLDWGLIGYPWFFD